MNISRVFLLLCLGTVSSVANAECSFCHQDRVISDLDEAEPRMGSITTTCTELLNTYNQNKEELERNRNKCVEHQLLGYQAGCCTTVDTQNGCSICADGSEPVEGYVVPTDGTKDRNPEDCTEGWGYQPYAFNGVWREGECRDTRLQRAGFYCGCPNTYQEQWLCPTKEAPRNPKRGDFIRFEKCGATEFLFSILKAGEIKDARTDFGFDYPAWCECPGVTLDNDFDCQFCPGDTNIKAGYHDQIFNSGTQNVRDPNGKWDYRRTCAQAEDYTRYVTKDDRCQSDPLNEARALCCPASALGVYLSMVATGALVFFNIFF